MSDSPICNPHLDGGPFYWSGGPVGVLLVHGFTSSTAEVRLLARLLHHQGHTVAGPLLPGHLTRPQDLNRVSWQDWARAVEEGYRRLAERCEKVFVGGTSTGGVLSLYLASMRAEVAGILAYAPALRLQLTTLDVIKLRLLAPFISYVPKPNSKGDTLWQGYYVNPLKGTLQLLQLQRETLARLSQIKQPILVVQGRSDATVHPQVPEIISRKVNSSLVEIHWMERSPHVLLLDCELDEIANITLGFMDHVLQTHQHLHPT